MKRPAIKLPSTKSLKFDSWLGHRPKPGALPGTLVIKPDAFPSRVTLLAYGEINFIEKDIENVEEITTFLEEWPVVWVSVEGLGNKKILKEISDLFEIHRLALEDVVNTPQRSKMEEFEDKVFIIQRLARWTSTIETEQFSMFFSKDFVLTFQETHEDSLRPIRERIRNAKGRVRQYKADYLAYAIMDTVFDNYFPVLEGMSEKIEALERGIEADFEDVPVNQIHALKRQLLTVRRAIWPQREVLATLMRTENKILAKDTRIYLRDCHDHVIQIIDLVETYRELIAGLFDMHLTYMSHKMNEVMKVLTIIATIFIPLTFISGIYGMNFNTTSSPWNMPELNWIYGYPFALGLMGATALGLVFFFKKKRWI